MTRAKRFPTRLQGSSKQCGRLSCLGQNVSKAKMVFMILLNASYVGTDILNHTELCMVVLG
jgi:hypothetical protein